MSEPIFISIQYKPEEVNNGYWAVTKDVVLPRALLGIFSFTFSLPVFCLVVFAVTHKDIGSTTPSITESLVGFLAMVAPLVMPVAATAVIWILAKQNTALSYTRRPVFHLPMTFILSEAGLKVTSTGGSGTIDWQHLRIGIETDESFCLGSSAEEIFILPKRAFAAAAEVKAVRAILRAHIVNYKHVGKGRADSSFTYEKPEILSITIDGKEYKSEAQLAPEAEAASAVSASSAVAPSADEVYSFDGDEVNAAEILASEIPITAVLSGAAEAEAGNTQVAVDLHPSSGLAVEVVYRPEEIIDAEKIHFFRKKLPFIVKGYIAHALLIPMALFTVGYIADGLTLTMGLLRQYGGCFLLYVPVLAIHALTTYHTIMDRVKHDKSLSKSLVFQLSDESCGLRLGEKYSVVTWWHFQECWETDLAYILLYGAQGRAMWVIPKRAFSDRMAAASANDLLKRKIANFKELV